MKPNPLGQVAPQYKPKTPVVRNNEVIEPGEFYSLDVDSYLFRGRLMPGQSIMMRKGCLAGIGDIVQLANTAPVICNTRLYQMGVEYTAVCVSIETPMELFNRGDEKLGKSIYHCRYVLNGEERKTPWFSSPSRAWKAMNMLIDKYGCEAGVYGEHEVR